MKHRAPFDEFAFLARKESATSLVLAGKRLMLALDGLAAFNFAAAKGEARVRDRLLQEACDALHAYRVQKELNGISDNAMLKEVFAVSAEVWRRLASTTKSASRKSRSLDAGWRRHDHWTTVG